MEIKFDDLLKNQQRLTIPGFARQEALVSSPNCFPPPGMDVNTWWLRFKKNLLTAFDAKKRIAIFRSGHGEFSFALGVRERPKELKKLVRYFISRIYRIAYFQSTFYSGTPKYGYETYKQWHLKKLRNEFAKYVRWISENGILSMYFADKDAFPLSFQRMYLEWLNKNGVILKAGNYSHIYFIYALFHGPEFSDLIKRKKMLVVSSDQPQRTKNLQKMAEQNRLAGIEFISISRNHSLQDDIALLRDYAPDLCLVGAGVGAAKMIYQLRKYTCPIIDVGYVLDTMAFPEMRKQRIYCVHDGIWDEFFPNNDPPYKEQFN